MHRNPGDDSTLSPVEQPFAVARTWVQQEAEEAAAGGSDARWECHAHAAQGSTMQYNAVQRNNARLLAGQATGMDPPAMNSPAHYPAGEGGFTRVLIGDLKPDVLQLIMADEAGTTICQVGGSGWRLACVQHAMLSSAGSPSASDRLAPTPRQCLPGTPSPLSGTVSGPAFCQTHCQASHPTPPHRPPPTPSGAGAPVPLLPAWGGRQPGAAGGGAARGVPAQRRALPRHPAAVPSGLPAGLEQAAGRGGEHGEAAPACCTARAQLCMLGSPGPRRSSL